MSQEDISEDFGESHYCEKYKIWKLWRIPTENGKSRTHLVKLQGSES
jgi:hypothetical protein